MKTLIFVLSLLIVNIGVSQNIPNMDTIKSVLLVSHKHSLDKPILKLFKKRQDIALFINVKDKEVYGFVDGDYNLFGKITKFNLDSTGHVHIFVNMNDRTKGKTVTNEIKICYTIGDGFFTILNGSKIINHTKIECEFHKEKLINVDFN